MPKPPSFARYPSKPHASGQARIVVQGETHYLGVWGSAASHERYNALRAEWTARLSVGGEHPPSPVVTSPVLTVADLLGRYWSHVKARCTRQDGSLKQHADNIARSLRPAAVMYGTSSVHAFGPKAIKEVRKAILRGWTDPVGGERGPTNRIGTNNSVDRLRAAWRWAVEEELIPEPLWRALLAVRSLTVEDVGRPDPPRKRPPKVADVLATLERLNPVVRRMARVQMLTGARPSELYGLTPGDIVRTGGVELEDGTPLELEEGKPLDCATVWVARLDLHKTLGTGGVRYLFFGPKAQEELRLLLEGRADNVPLFSPKEARVLLLAERRAKRTTPLYPRDIRRAERLRKFRETTPAKLTPGDRYTRHTYHQAVHRACEKAGVPQWDPYKLRALAATLIAREFGMEEARRVLGHRQIRTTSIYVAEDVGKAAAVLGLVG